MKASVPLLCINATEKRIRRWLRNEFGRLWSTDEWEVVNWSAVTLAELEALRLSPQR